MAGVLEQMRGSRRKLMRCNVTSTKLDQRYLELQTAMEILAEVFGTDMSEIDEMLKLRYREGSDEQALYSRKKQGHPLLKHSCREAGEWPTEFFLAE